MQEKIQYKFQVDRDTILDATKSKGVKFSSPSNHSYTYFNVPVSKGNSFATLRIKVSEDKRKIDMKVRNNQTNERNHFEIDIDNIEQAQSILEHIGCTPIFTFHKKRQTWIADFVRLDLDTTEELGTFLEVKFEPINKVKAENFLREIGIDPSTYDKRSVIEIYLERNKS